MRVKLTLYIEYDGGDFYEIRQQLHDAAEHLYDNGLLSFDDEDIAISECTHEVTLLSTEGEQHVQAV